MYNSTTKDRDAWRKIAVRRDRSHEPLVDKLCTDKNGQKPVFPRIKDLMVFAAMIGFSKNRRKKISNDNISIILETYATDQKDAYIYLIALVTEQDTKCLKDENLLESIRIFEEYCNAGLDEIQLWFDENPRDHIGIDTLADKVFEQAILNEKSISEDVNPEDIEFDLG